MNKSTSLFKIGDKVQTNREYVYGFNDKIIPIKHLKWLKDLTIVHIDFLEDIADRIKDSDNTYIKPFLYTCQSKQKTYIINECFLKKERIEND